MRRSTGDKSLIRALANIDTDDRKRKPSSGREKDRHVRMPGLIRRHKLLTALGVVTIIGIGGRSFAMPYLEEMCARSPQCSVSGAIMNKPGLIPSEAVFPNTNPLTNKTKPYVQGIGSYSIMNVRKQANGSIAVGVDLKFPDLVKFADANGRKKPDVPNHDPVPNQNPAKITATGYLDTLCGPTGTPALKKAGQDDLNRVISTTQSHAYALVASDAVVTPTMLKSGENGYTASPNDPKAPDIFVYDTKTSVRLNC